MKQETKITQKNSFLIDLSVKGIHCVLDNHKHWHHWYSRSTAVYLLAILFLLTWVKAEWKGHIKEAAADVDYFFGFRKLEKVSFLFQFLQVCFFFSYFCFFFFSISREKNVQRKLSLELWEERKKWHKKGQGPTFCRLWKVTGYSVDLTSLEILSAHLL